jgi:uncharacterized protein (TIGR01569 family)
MADGGAWQSGVFDTTGRYGKQGTYNTQHGLGADHSIAVGVPPPMYNQAPPSQAPSAWSSIISITLRVATIVFTACAFAITASNKGERVDVTYDSWNESLEYYLMKWNIIKNSAAAFLLAANVIVCFYSLVQLVVSLVKGCIGARMLSGPTTPASLSTFCFDQAMTYLMMGACGAGACHAVYNSKVNISGEDLCNGFRVFCDKQISALVMTFLAFVSISLSVALHNFRWYKMAKKAEKLE